jgi:hypothetical protein
MVLIMIVYNGRTYIAKHFLKVTLREPLQIGTVLTGPTNLAVTP